MRNVIRLTILAFACAVCIILFYLFAPFKFHIDKSASCLYRYQYLNDMNETCNDAVQISSEDSKVIIDIMRRQKFRYNFDYVSGVTIDHSLEFSYDDGKVKRIILRYGSGYTLRIDAWNLECDLSYEDHEELYRILDKYQRFDALIVD